MKRQNAIIGLVLVVLITLAAGFAALEHGKRELADRVRAHLADELREHVGYVESVELDLSATRESDNEERFVFDVVGARGEGVLTVEWVDHEARTATLRLRSGEEHDLLPEPEPEDDE